MANNLASPTFSSGPNNKLATVDVYNVQNQQVVNTIQSIIQKYDPKLMQSMGGMNRLDINSATNSILRMGGTSYQTQNLINRMAATSPAMSKAIKAMDNEVKGLFAKASTGLGDAGGKVWAEVKGGAKYAIDASKVFVNEQLGSLVKSITGSDSLLTTDLGAQVCSYGAAIKSCLGEGVGDIAKEVMGVISDRNVLTVLASQISPTVISTSSVRDLLALSENVSRGTLLAGVPNLLNLFSSSYKTSSINSNYGYSYPGTSGHQKTYTEVMAAYTSVSPTWSEYVRQTEAGPEPTICIYPIMGGSADFNAILTEGGKASNGLVDKICLLAPNTRIENVEALLARQYPKTAFNFNQSIRAVADPRTLR